MQIDARDSSAQIRVPGAAASSGSGGSYRSLGGEATSVESAGEARGGVDGSARSAGDPVHPAKIDANTTATLNASPRGSGAISDNEELDG